MKLRSTAALLAVSTILGGCAHPLDGLTSYRDGPLPTDQDVSARLDTPAEDDGDSVPSERSRRGGVDPHASLRNAQRDMTRWAAEKGFWSNSQIAAGGDALPSDDPGAVQRRRKIASHAAPVADLRPIDTGLD